MSLAQSTLWSQDSPVSQPVTRVSAEALLMLAGSGQKYVGSFDPRGPLGFALRTFLGLSVWDSMTYSATWSLRATKQRRVFIRLRRLGRRTSGSASSSSATASESLWLTPNASDENGDENGGKVARPGLTNTRIGPSGKKQQLSLKQQVREQWPTPTVNGNTNRRGATPKSGDGLATLARLWPTPTSTAGDGRSEQTIETWTARAERTFRTKGIRNGLPLNVAVQMWPTPQERDWRTGSKPDSPRTARKARQGWSPNLNDVAAWSTPAAQDAKNATLPASPATRDTLPGDLLRQGSAGKLNPAWVTQLMGFPDGWLDIPAGPRAPAKRNTTGKRRAPSRPATEHPDAPRR